MIQNGRIVGAVTHVLVNDPTKGYAIFLESMLNHGIFIYPSVYEYQCKTRHFDDFTNKKDFQNTEYIIIPYGAPTYSEYRKSSESYVSSEMYYEQFEKATIVLIDEEYDLAVISFESKEPLNVLSVSEDNPNTNEKIAVISNPEGERFVYSFGVITSKDYYLFESNDKLLPVNTFTHNAYIAPGSSGSAVLNEEMRIVGINIGGGTDFMNRFKYGAMIPCELIHEFFQKNSFE